MQIFGGKVYLPRFVSKLFEAEGTLKVEEAQRWSVYIGKSVSLQYLKDQKRFYGIFLSHKLDCNL